MARAYFVKDAVNPMKGQEATFRDSVVYLADRFIPILPRLQASDQNSSNINSDWPF